jgi:hypothetical protein
MAADCRNSRLERLGPPAHCPIAFPKSFTSVIASLPCPATSSVPSCLLPYLQWSPGGCLDGSGLQKLQTCTAWASSALPHCLSKELYQSYCTTTMPSNICSAHLASPIPAVVSWWLPIWQRTAEIPDLNGLSLQRRAPLPFQRALPVLSHYYHAK